MENLPSLGTSINQIVQPTFKTYIPLLLSNAQAIKSTKCKTFTYGDHPRQQLDVYYPSSSNTTNNNPPILIFLYGGGLIRGSKTLPMIPENLVHANVGHFFAEKYGYMVVIPDYRLISHGARFPSGGEDLALVLEWIIGNLGLELSLEDGKGGNDRDLFMMGNSAGGIHLSTFLLADEFQGTKAKILGGGNEDGGEKGLRLRGVVELSVPFHFGKADSDRADTLTEYYGDQVEERCPMGLLKALMSRSSIRETFPGVRFLILNGTLDPEDEILIPKKDFIKTWLDGKSEPGDELEIQMMEGQNHISPPLSLGTNKENEEAWGHQVAAFFNSTTTQS